MAALKRLRCCLLSALLPAAVLSLGGCGPQEPVISSNMMPPRVAYEGQHFANTISSQMVTDTAEELQAAGYERIGTITSEPTVQSMSVSKAAFEKDPQGVLNSIAPENDKDLRDYFAVMDREACKEATRAGGEKVRLEEIRRAYPVFRKDIAELMEKTMAADITVKTVESTKVWSVWLKKQ